MRDFLPDSTNEVVQLHQPRCRMLDVTNFIGTLATGAVGAVVAWFGTHYVGGPILTLRQLRQAIHEELFFTKNIGWVHADGRIAAVEKDRHDLAVLELRRLAAKMSALNAIWPRHLNCYLRCRRFDIDKAIKGLTGLSNGLSDPADHSQFITQIEDALSLPRSYSDELLKDLRTAQNRRFEKSYEQNEPQ